MPCDAWSASTRDAARRDLFEYIEGFYNRRRRLSIGYRTLIQQYEAWFEKDKLAA